MQTITGREFWEVYCKFMTHHETRFLFDQLALRAYNDGLKDGAKGVKPKRINHIDAHFVAFGNRSKQDYPAIDTIRKTYSKKYV